MPAIKFITPLEVYKTGKTFRAPGNKIQVIHATRKGVKRRDLISFTKAIGYSLMQITKIIPTSYSSLSKKTVFNKETSERIFEIAEIFSLGHDVFGDENKFKRWLQKKSIALGGVTPFSLLDTSHGVQMVYNELQRINYGIFS